MRTSWTQDKTTVLHPIRLRVGPPRSQGKKRTRALTAAEKTISNRKVPKTVMRIEARETEYTGKQGGIWRLVGWEEIWVQIKKPKLTKRKR